MFGGFKVPADKSARQDKATLRREKTKYLKELSGIEKQIALAQISLDNHTKNGKTELTRMAAVDIARLEKDKALLSSVIEDLQTSEYQTKNSQALVTRVNTQKLINRTRANILRTVDAQEVFKMQYEAEKQKDQIEMTDEALRELFEKDEAEVDSLNSRVDQLLEISLAKSMLEGTMPSTSSYIPSVSPATKDTSSVHIEPPVLSSSSTSYPSSSNSLPLPSPSSSQQTSNTPSSSSSTEADLIARFQNLMSGKFP